MRNFVVFFLLGLALVQLSGAMEKEEEKEISLLENQEDFEVQALAEARRKCKGKKCKERQGKNKGNKTRKGKKGKNTRKGKRGKKGKNTRKGKRGKGGKKGKNTRKGKRGKKGKNTRNGKGGKKEKNTKKGKAINKGKGNNTKKGRKNGSKQNNGKGEGRQVCVAGCSDLIIGMMKAARKQNTYLKQYNRIVNVQKQAGKKGGKKDQYGSDTADGPLKLLISAGGGNASDLECAGSQTNNAAVSMKNLTAKLEKCTDEIGEACNVTKKMVVIKDEWKTCSEDMKKFKVMADACLKKAGAEACTCFGEAATVALKDKVVACNGTEMQIAAAADLAAKKACMAVFGECRGNGEKIRPVLSACQSGGPSVAETKKEVGAILVNSAANDKIIAKTKALVAAAGRKLSKRASVTFEGDTYPLDTCTQWADAALAWIAALDSDLVTDIADAGNTIADTTVTCTATDLGKLTAVSAKAEIVSKKAAKKVEILQEKLEKITGTTVAPAAAIAAAEETTVAGSAGGTTAAAAGETTAAAAGETTAAAAGGTTTPAAAVVTNSMRRLNKVQKIMAAFKNRA